MKISELLEKTPMMEKWSKEYKDSIDCSNPKGFSQRAHCDSLKKKRKKMKIHELLQPLTEATGALLLILDIDDTLMRTTAEIGVVKRGETQPYKYISSAEFNSYQPERDEHGNPMETFDFEEFQNAEKFHKESKPIHGVWQTVLRTQQNLKRRPGSLIAIVTARSEFDNQELFKQTFLSHGLDISKVKFFTVGGSKNKKPLIEKLLGAGDYSETTMLDDHPENLRDFLSLHQDFPEITFKAFLIDPEHGKVSNNAVILPAKKSVTEVAGVGLVVPGVNMPKGMHPDEIRRQAIKFGNQVDKNGVPPLARPDGVFEEEIWDKENPKKTHKKLTASQKTAAKARAKREGRPYPNLVDNMWAMKNG